jgi:large subunit ribosomal protein L17
MVTPTKGARLGSSPAHERIILANLATQLFEHGKIKTTKVRAKRVQPLAEHLITVAKRNTLASRRQVATTIRDKSIVHTLVTVIAPEFAEREGGYTRITKIERRKGDQAEMAIIELVTEPLVKKPSKKKKPAAIKVPEPKGDTTVEDAEIATAEEILETINEEEGTGDETAPAADTDSSSEE